MPRSRRSRLALCEEAIVCHERFVDACAHVRPLREVHVAIYESWQENLSWTKTANINAASLETLSLFDGACSMNSFNDASL